MARQYSNTSVETSLVNPVSDSDTSITINDNSGLPVTFPFSLTLDYQQATVEVVTVTALTGGTTYTVIRGEDGTAAQAHDAGAVVVHGGTARDFAEPQAHIDASSNIHGLSGGATVVGTSSSQTLTNKTISGADNTITNVPTTALDDPLEIGNVILTDPTPDVDVAATLADHETRITGVEAGFRYSETVSFTSSGTFTKASYPGLRAIRMREVGPGGGAGAGNATSSGHASVGGGGGGGEFVEAWILEGDLASSVTVTIGTGGAGSSSSSAGSDGGTTSFGSITAEGGGGGSTGSSGTPPRQATGGVGGTGGTPAVGDGGVIRRVPGASGGLGVFTSQGNGGEGGNSLLSVKGPRTAGAVTGTAAGANGNGPGTGGTGGVRGTGATGTVNGGNGANGIVYVDIYL